MIYEQEVEERAVRAYRDRPVPTEEQGCYVIRVRPRSEAIHAARLLGWRVYVSNAPVARLTLADGGQAYCSARWIERDFRRLKGRPLEVRPRYVQWEDRGKGMVRLLSLALRVLTLVEQVVRDRLRQAGQALTGLYAGNPKRETARPTAERLLRTFRNVVLTIVRLPGQTIRQVTPLSDLQWQILGCWACPARSMKAWPYRHRQTRHSAYANERKIGHITRIETYPFPRGMASDCSSSTPILPGDGTRICPNLV